MFLRVRLPGVISNLVLYDSRFSSLAPSNRFLDPSMKSPPLIRPGAETNLSGWLVREEASEMSEANERGSGRKKKRNIGSQSGQKFIQNNYKKDFHE